jgi:hypothetical protein
MALSVLMVIIVLGGIYLGFFMAGKSERQSEERQALAERGVRATATITKLWHTGGKSDTHKVRYHYSVDGREFEVSGEVSRSTWKTLTEGQEIGVRYDPANPSLSHPSDWEYRVTPVWLAGLVPGMFLLLAVFFMMLLRRQWRLLADGRAAPGIVTKTRRGGKTKVVMYEFRLPTGAVQQGRDQTGHRQLPEIGSAVCILYDPDNPKRNELYPPSLVKLVT